jgi:hypothetical protein
MRRALVTVTVKFPARQEQPEINGRLDVSASLSDQNPTITLEAGIPAKLSWLEHLALNYKVQKTLFIRPNLEACKADPVFDAVMGHCCEISFQMTEPVGLIQAIVYHFNKVSSS